ncbi:SCO family protein [Geodermatophilus sp. FMUSA9-8]|uniref:SCO family protein n=1 Tax=Geodermatophilus sp. FMUSA9-8 TaxID=3120155 RepID=UPI003008FB3E
MTGIRTAAVAAAVAALIGLGACATGAEPGPAADVVGAGDDDGFAGTLLADPPVPRPALVLPATDGRAYDLTADSDGVTALFFGYTRCPDICPTTMADVAAARRELPRSAQDRVTVVFVTEDPANDTPPVLRAWLDRFDEDFVGLVGGDARTRDVLTDLHLTATEGHVDPPTSAPHGDGGFEHSGVVYIFGPDDERTVVHTGGTTVAQYASDLRELLGPA